MFLALCKCMHSDIANFRKKASSPTGGIQPMSTQMSSQTQQQNAQRQNLQTNLSTSPPSQQVITVILQMNKALSTLVLHIYIYIIFFFRHNILTEREGNIYSFCSLNTFFPCLSFSRCESLHQLAGKTEPTSSQKSSLSGLTKSSIIYSPILYWHTLVKSYYEGYPLLYNVYLAVICLYLSLHKYIDH